MSRRLLSTACAVIALFVAALAPALAQQPAPPGRAGGPGAPGAGRGGPGGGAAAAPAMPISNVLRAKGSQHRSFPFDQKDTPYRLYVPTTWDGQAKLPVIIFLHGAGGDENTSMDRNDKQMEVLAEKYGFIAVTPLGYTRTGAYGSAMRLAAPFGDPEGQARIRAEANADPAKLKELDLSEKEVMAVTDHVIAEYSADTSRIFLAGHSMGAGGTWHLGNKYAERWAAIAPLSGPFVEEAVQPFAKLKTMPIFYTEGTQAPSLPPSRKMYEALKAQGFNIQYQEYDADHPGMIKPALPYVFEFFAAQKPKQ